MISERPTEIRNSMILKPLAYVYVMTMIMVNHVNHYAPRLHLPIKVPVEEQNIQLLSVGPATTNVPGMPIYGGRIQVDNYSFTLAPSDRFTCKLENDGYQSFGIPLAPNESSRSAMERASTNKYTISTHDIYRMATNWLVALDMDMPELEKLHAPIVDQYPVFQSSRGPVPSPLLEVGWQNSDVSVEISAVSGDLLKLDAGDGSFSKSEKILIQDLGGLISIPDEEFEKYSTLERSNLLVRFGGLHCTDLHCPGINDPEPSGTNTVSQGAKN
jgi:hypothetical protein